MNIEERNEQIKNLYLSDNISMEEVGRRFNLCRVQIRRILLEQGISGQETRKKRFDRWISQVLSLIESDPTLTNSQIAGKINVSLMTVNRILRKTGVKRDQHLIQSNIKKVWRRREKAKLNRDLLFQLYVVDEKSTIEIGKLLNYSSAAIGINLKKHGIKMRPQNRPARKKS